MDRQRVTGAVVVLSIVLGVMASGIPAAPPPAKDVSPEKDKIHWHKDIFSARDASVDSGKPMLVVVSATWCGPCKRLKKTTLNHPQMAKYINGNFIAVHLDLDRDERVAEALEVEQVPSTIVLSPDVDLLGRHVGFATVRKYHKLLEKSRRLQSEIQQARHAIQADK